MGTNKRYAESFDRRLDQRIIEQMMREHQPETLRSEELQLDEQPLTRCPRPRPVRAWVRYGQVPLLVEAQLVAWTPYAAAIRWSVPDGGEHRAWVWASAVRS